MKKQILILGVFLMPFCVYAEEAELPSCGTNCTYTLTENGVDANGKTTYSLTVKPVDTSKDATINSYDRCNSCVGTEVGNYAPWRFENVTEVTIQEGITSIGSRSFEDMKSVTSLNLPEGLQSIEREAFNGIKISTLNLPNSLASIESFAFGGIRLEEISGIPASLTKLNSYIFNGSQITDLVIPSNIKQISPYVFGDGDYYANNLIENLYCEEAMVSQCEAALQWRKDNGVETKVIPYQKTENGQVFYNNKWYDSANDILSNNYAKKRIYTVDEANKVSGRKNTFKIRYK